MQVHRNTGETSFCPLAVFKDASSRHATDLGQNKWPVHACRPEILVFLLIALDILPAGLSHSHDSLQG